MSPGKSGSGDHMADDLNVTPFTGIGLQNPKSPTNVGAVMRAAGCFGVDSVIYTGERYARAKKFNTDTKDTASRIPLLGVDSLLDNTPADVSVVCVELVEGASSLVHFIHPPRALYLFGPEDGSLDQSLVDHADAVIFVPTVGCLNLAASINVVLYDRCSKVDNDDNPEQCDQLIKRSRDRNNRLRLR